MTDSAYWLLAPSAALFPGLLLLVYFNARQDYHLSADIVWSAVLLGATSSLLSVAIELPLDLLIDPIGDAFDRAATRAFLGTALPEEAAKFAMVYFIAMRHEDYGRPVDALVLSVAVALGFASYENLLYLLQSDDWGRTATARAMTAVPSHVVNAMLMGYFLGRAHLDPRRAAGYFLFALAAPTINHGAYDLPLFLIDEINSDPALAQGASREPLILLFAGIIALGSLIALLLWRDLLRRDAAEAAGRSLPYTVDRLPDGLRRWEGRIWLVLGGGLALASLAMSGISFLAPLGGSPGWASLYPQYFMVASSILPCLFGLAMLAHGLRLQRLRPA